jgi:hypothetical protein
LLEQLIRGFQRPFATYGEPPVFVMRHERRPFLFFFALITVITAACGWSRSPTLIADFIEQFPDARKQPSTAAFDIADLKVEGVAKRSILAREQTRLTYHVTVPPHARFRVSIAIAPDIRSEAGQGVLFLVGVSDGQWYQNKHMVTLDPIQRSDDRHWRELVVNLEEFAGLTVDIVLNTRATSTTSTAGERLLAAWGSPTVTAR